MVCGAHGANELPDHVKLMNSNHGSPGVWMCGGGGTSATQGRRCSAETHRDKDVHMVDPAEAHMPALDKGCESQPMPSGHDACESALPG